MSNPSILVCIVGLVLVGWSATDSIAAPDECKGKKEDRAAHCGEDETPGGQHRSLTVTLDDDGSGTGQPIGFVDIKGDDDAVYSDSHKSVSAALGGQAQPNKPGFQLSLKRKGPDSRAITASLTCAGLPGGPDNCGDITTKLPDVTDDTMSLGLRPYESNCPDGQPDGQCYDVFTMGESTQLMSFRINFWNQDIFIEVASAIGGEGAPNPGRCLSLLNEQQRDDFLLDKCLDPAGCNVSVTAYDDGFNSGTGKDDGENDEWHIDASDVWALMCNRRSGYEKVYGMTQLDIGAVAIKE